MEIDARRLVHYVTVCHRVQLAVVWLDDVATCHCARVHVAQLGLRLVAALVEAVGDLALVAAAEDVANISKLRDRIVLPKEGLDLVISRLVEALKSCEGWIMA